MEYWVRLIAWGSATLLVIIAHYFKGKNPGTWDLDLSDFINIGVSLAGVVSSCGLIVLAFTSSELKDLLGADIVALVLGAIAVIWVSIQQIIKTF